MLSFTAKRECKAPWHGASCKPIKEKCFAYLEKKNQNPEIRHCQVCPNEFDTIKHKSCVRQRNHLAAFMRVRFNQFARNLRTGMPLSVNKGQQSTVTKKYCEMNHRFGGLRCTVSDCPYWATLSKKEPVSALLQCQADHRLGGARCLISNCPFWTPSDHYYDMCSPQALEDVNNDLGRFDDEDPPLELADLDEDFWFPPTARSHPDTYYKDNICLNVVINNPDQVDTQQHVSHLVGFGFAGASMKEIGHATPPTEDEEEDLTAEELIVRPELCGLLTQRVLSQENACFDTGNVTIYDDPKEFCLVEKQCQVDLTNQPSTSRPNTNRPTSQYTNDARRGVVSLSSAMADIDISKLTAKERRAYIQCRRNHRINFVCTKSGCPYYPSVRQSDKSFRSTIVTNL